MPIPEAVPGTLDGIYPMPLALQSAAGPLWAKELASLWAAHNSEIRGWILTHLLFGDEVLDDVESDFLARMWVREQHEHLAAADFDAAWALIPKSAPSSNRTRRPRQSTLYARANYWNDMSVLAFGVRQYAYGNGVYNQQPTGDAAFLWHLDEAWRSVLHGDEAGAKQWLDRAMAIPACEDLVAEAASERGVCRYAGRVALFPHRPYFKPVMAALELLRQHAPEALATVVKYVPIIYYEDYDGESGALGLTAGRREAPEVWLFAETFKQCLDPTCWALVIYHESMHVRVEMDDLPVPQGAKDPEHVVVYEAEAELARRVAPDQVPLLERRTECARTGKPAPGKRCYTDIALTDYWDTHPMRDYVQR